MLRLEPKRIIPHLVPFSLCFLIPVLVLVLPSVPYHTDKENHVVDDIHWGDALHMTAAGYDRFADIIYDHIKLYL